MAQCPGQDRRFWKPEDIYEVDCPKCGAKVEFWKDDVSRRCRKCHHRFRNPRLDLGCAEWCSYAKYCIGRDIKEIEKYAPCADESVEKMLKSGAVPPPTDGGVRAIRKESEPMEETVAEKVEKLDLKPMPPFERHEKIFEVWNTLKAGETLEITNDHDPKPLRYQFQAEYPNSFRWTYKLQGPKDWIVEITKINGSLDTQPKDRIKDVLKKLHTTPDNSAVKEEAKNILRQVGAIELAALEQELIREGIARDEIMGLCDVHLEVMAESLKANQIIPKAGHPIHTMMEEHKMILGYLEKLKEVMSELKKRDSFEEAQHNLTLLTGIAHYLVEAEKHHQREEDVIFPMLEKYGITEPPEIMRMEHTELRKRKKTLHEIAQNPPPAYAEFIKELGEAGQYLAEELAKHIFKEDNILYQAALKTFKPEEWKDIKRKCDEIGYCCFTPHTTNNK